MNTKICIGIMLVMSIFLGGPAFATTNLLVPVAGSDFIPMGADPNVNYHNSNAGCFRNWGGIENIEAVASLGHALGGGNGNTFRILGWNSGNGTLTCNVWVQSSATGQVYNNAPYTGSITTSGWFNLPITATPPQGDYFYSLSCVVPIDSLIAGVMPTT